MSGMSGTLRTRTRSRHSLKYIKAVTFKPQYSEVLEHRQANNAPEKCSHLVDIGRGISACRSRLCEKAPRRGHAQKLCAYGAIACAAPVNLWLGPPTSLTPVRIKGKPSSDAFQSSQLVTTPDQRTLSSYFSFA